MPAISDGAVLGAQMLDLQHLDLKGSYRLQMHLRQRADSVNANPEPHHIILIFRKSFDSGRVKYVPHRFITQFPGQFPGIVRVHSQLSAGKFIFRRVFSSREMRVNRFYAHFLMVAQETRQLLKLTCHKTEPVHTGVKFNMYRVSGDTS